MADAQELFHAVISATDETSKTLQAITKRLRDISGGHKEMERTGTHAFGAISEQITLLHSRFGDLRTSVGEVGHSLSDLVPVMAGLGAVGSLAGLFELTERGAEAQATLAHTAAAIGITAQSMQRLDYAAKMTDTNIESMHKGLERLNKEIALGSKDKDVAGLFKHLHIDTKGITDATQILPQLADAFEHTTSATMRGRMANALFGKSGADLIPMLTQGSDKLADLMREASTIGHVSNGPQIAAGVAYADSMKKAHAAVEGFKDTLTDALAPVLTPIVDGMTDWVVANRDWIATGIADKVRQLGDWARSIDFGTIVRETTDFIHGAADALDKVGGLKTAFGALALVMGTEAVAKITETGKVLKEMSEVIWGPVIESLGAFTTSLFATRDAAFALDMALDANPFGVFIAGAAIAGAVGYELWSHWAWVKAQFSGLYDWFSHQHGWVQNVLTIAVPFVFLPMKIMENWKPIKVFFTGLWDDIKAIFDKAMGWINPILDKVSSVAHFIDNHTAHAVSRAVSEASDALGNVFVGVHGLDTATVQQQPPPIFSPFKPLQIDGPANDATGYTSPYNSPDGGGAGPYGGGLYGGGGKVQVDVFMHDLPPGSRVRARSSGAVAVNVKQSEGQAFGGVPAYSN